jgi:SAM-dependent methyltransferase
LNVLEKLHEQLVARRRIERLAQHLSARLPQNARVLDVGCGDGYLASRILSLRADLHLEGIDVLARKRAAIPVGLYDGSTIPVESGSYNVVMLVDVVHHAVDPHRLLQEAARVASDKLVVKDHFADAIWAHSTLRLMDWFGNSHQGVNLPYNYWTEAQWRESLAQIGLSIEWRARRLGLYPWPASLLFDRSLHFVADVATAPSPSVA